MNTISRHIDAFGEAAVGRFDDTVSIDTIKSYGVMRTLNDEPVEKGSTSVLEAICKYRLAHDLDVRDDEIRWTNFVWDWNPDEQVFDVSMVWYIKCDHCEWTATLQGKFDANLCNFHYGEAWDEYLADLEHAIFLRQASRLAGRADQERVRP